MIDLREVLKNGAAADLRNEMFQVRDGGHVRDRLSESRESRSRVPESAGNTLSDGVDQIAKTWLGLPDVQQSRSRFAVQNLERFNRIVGRIWSACAVAMMIRETERRLKTERITRASSFPLFEHIGRTCIQPTRYIPDGNVRDTEFERITRLRK